MKEILKRYLSADNVLAFFIWAFIMVIVIYWNNNNHF